ncbi:DUF2306 domain-containing protein [Actinokineospora inagensis]|uniref:DUF2306 domain-containing protein n=1 Tax=Actinokineospora inagensis TaxID=103730 RepID=UPI0004174A6A|nr:DUF2306 domain-containing protein [Actinokineospora inagensis]
MTTPVRRRRIAWAAVAVSAVGIAAYSIPAYLTGDRSLSRIPINPALAPHYLSIVSHAVPASLLLFIGPFQFAARLRARRPALHRVAGRIYLVSMLIAAVSALAAATFSIDGFPVRVAFYLLSAGWLYTAYRGFSAIRRGQVPAHRVWMIRNYALSFAAVVLRVLLGLGLAVRSPLNLTFNDIYTAGTWASILISVVVSEYFLIRPRSIAA